MSATKMFTIVVASGSSTRYGKNKLAETINGETILDRSIRIAKEESDGVILVVSNPQDYDQYDVNQVVLGGKTRTQSVKNGLDAVPNDVEIIAVHDGARPGASGQLYKTGKKLIVQGAVAAIPAINVVDTVKQITNEKITTIDRATLKAVQTPQIFNAKILRSAHQQNIEDTDDAALVEALGENIELFAGEEANKKITTPNDLKILTSLLSKANIQTIGTGYDIHPFSTDENKKLVLAGLSINYRGLEGHSDADAVFHALTDALLSAIGEKDLGTMFPANEEKYKGASSDAFLCEAVDLCAEQKLVINTVAIIINAQEPKLKDHLSTMKKNIETQLKKISTDETIVSLTPKHGEGVGDIGNAKAIAVYCTALLSKQELE